MPISMRYEMKENKESRTVKDFMNYALGDLFVKGFLFISLPLLSRIMDPTQYGKLSLINTAIMILYVFISLNMQNAVLNRYMKSKEHFDNYLGSIILFLIPFQVIIVLTEPLYRNIISKLLGVDAGDLIWIIAICILLSYIYIYSSYLQASKQSLKYVQLNVFSKVTEIVFIFTFAYFMTSHQYLSKIYSQLIISFVLMFYLVIGFKRIICFPKGTSDIKDALIFGIPLIIHVLSNSLLSQADRLMIANILGVYDAGIYSFSYNLGMCIIVVVMAWNSSWQPRLYKLLDANETTKIKNKVFYSTSLIFIVSALAILFSSEMITILAGKDYSQGSQIVPVIIFGNALIHIYMCFANFVFYQKKSVVISLATLFALVINICANYYVIPMYGIIGAAWATVLSYFMLCLFHYLAATFYTKNNIISIKYLFMFSLGLSVFIKLTELINQLHTFSSIIIKLLITMSVAVFIFKSKIYNKLS